MIEEFYLKVEKYSEFDGSGIVKYRKLFAKDLQEVLDVGLGMEFFYEVRKVVRCDYLVFLSLLSYAVKNIGDAKFYKDVMDEQFSNEFNKNPRVIKFYIDSLAFSKKYSDIRELVIDKIAVINDEWLWLDIAEILCDESLWDVVKEIYPNLTWSGTASKIKYVKVKNRLDLSNRFDSMPKINCIYINLEKDVDKKNKISNHLEENVLNYYRVPGVVAKDLPEYAVSLINRSVTLKDQLGALGCFLGHINALELVVQNKMDYALILEDDAVFYYRPSANVVNKILKNNFDVMYVNTKMMRQGHNVKNPFDCEDIHIRLREFPERIAGWGAYGYIVTYEGARKVLHNIYADKALGHFDGQLGSYGMIGIDFNAESKAHKVAKNFLKKYSNNSKALNVKCLNFPLIDFKDYGYSSRVSFS